MPKITLEERRLQILRQQLSSSKSVTPNSKKPKEVFQKASEGSFGEALSRVSISTVGGDSKEDVSYLYWDLRKVFILSLGAIALQGAIYLGLQMRLFHLWF